MTGPDSRVVLAPGDGSLGPLLRVADDRLAPGEGYGRHEHRAVDVVAVVLAGSLTHRWGAGVALDAGDVAVLRAGTGLAHDEVAGEGGARVLQCYLRSATPGAPAAHEVHRAARGWLELGRADARLWLGRAAPGEELSPPAGVVLVAGAAGLRRHGAGPVRTDEAATVVVWQVDAGRPSWAG
ncbi:pirin family protein [Blastococcus sp. VKM Ac-2987]|uniref:pirin family protein n=1 Tax=Blastococcus sp. VKM Ac-2987 TaxID=3004141 RepID=UPI0022ABC144|nr:pirin family protein [Blastococcus sp. VKM Ac-2987]MCZ2857253.1 pirin family protein [Blastococcus sp. VKM Ac-2987]